MVASVEDFDYILCDSEFEALVLECSLIKQNMPKYNILLKDSKGFHYIRVTPPPWTTIKAAKMIKDDGAEYIGPYYSSHVVKQSVDAALKAFKLPQCSKTAADFGKKRYARPCLNYHIGQCSAPCCGKITQQAHDEAAAAAIEFLKKGSADTLRELTEQMNEAAERLEFERAARLRDRIVALKSMSDRQRWSNRRSANRILLRSPILMKNRAWSCSAFAAAGFATARTTFSTAILMPPKCAANLLRNIIRQRRIFQSD